MGLTNDNDHHDGDAYLDPVIEEYKKNVDRTLIRHNLRLTVEQRLATLEAAVRDLAELREAMRKANR